MNDSDVTSFTPLFAINHRGVQLFAAPYAKRPLLTGEVEAAPAAAGTDNLGETNGPDFSNDSVAQLSSLPLLM